MKNKRVLKLRKKLKKFYEREKKVSFTKISKDFVDNIVAISQISRQLDPRTFEKHPGAVKDISKVEFGEDGNDFVNDMLSARLTYTYPKYGNL
jgi:hypothetical protein